MTLQLNGNMSVIDPIEPSLSRAKVIFFSLKIMQHALISSAQANFSFQEHDQW